MTNIIADNKRDNTHNLTASDIHGMSSIPHTENNDYEIDLRELYLTLKRRKEVVFGAIGCSLVLMIVFLLITSPVYTAKSMIQVNVAADRVVDIEAVVSGGGSDESAIQSEIDVLSSRSLAGRVITKLKLIDDQEFNKDAGVGSFAWLKKLMPFLNGDAEDKDVDQVVLTKTIDVFLKRLEIARKPKSYSVIISFSSVDSKKASIIANTIVEEYLVGQLSTKFDASKRANDWLNAKLDDLRKKVRESEMAVEVFSEENNLIETAGMTVNDQQLSELNTHLILARTERTQAEARLTGSKNGAIDTSSEVLNSSLIQSLRGQEAEVLRKKSDLTSRYGERHPKIINVNNELRDLRSKIEVEINKIKDGLQKEVEIAKSREDSLQKNLGQLQGKSGTSTKAKVQLAELVRQRDSDRSLYESFLSRSKETLQNKDLAQADAKIISYAEMPIKPSFPVNWLMLAIAMLVGGAIGIILAFLMEQLDNAFKNSAQVEKATGIASIGMVPALDRKTNFVSYVTTKVSSVFVESLRSILTAIHFSNPDNIPKSILVTSSVPEEGKTTFSVCLATMVAKSGQKVLLVDCDLKRPAVAKKFGVTSIKHGLGDYLTGEATEQQVILVDKKSGLHFMPANSNTANSQDLLGSNKMREFVKEMTAKYDLVVFDSPPVMAVSDALVAAKIVDAVVFIIRWDKTPRQIVKNALKQLKFSNIRLAGTILTHVNMDKLSRYGYGDQGYYYKNYKDYYSS